jgi:hypothetical protein
MIYKYPLSGPDVKIPLPQGTRILCVQVQYGVPSVWALIPDVVQTDVMEFRHLVIVHTGDEQPSGKTAYIGTFQLADGNYVGHLFEVLNETPR